MTDADHAAGVSLPSHKDHSPICRGLNRGADAGRIIDSIMGTINFTDRMKPTQAET